MLFATCLDHCTLSRSFLLHMIWYINYHVMIHCMRMSVVNCRFTVLHLNGDGTYSLNISSVCSMVSESDIIDLFTVFHSARPQDKAERSTPKPKYWPRENFGLCCMTSVSMSSGCGVSDSCSALVLSQSLYRVYVLWSVWTFFGRPYYRRRLWHTVSSVCLSVCLSVVCDVLYCGETVRLS